MNQFIYDFHDKLGLENRSKDPNISENAFKLTVDSKEFEKFRVLAGKDQSFNAMGQADILNKQRWLLIKHMG